MMPVIRINDATFVDLKSISTWISTNTPSETIDALVREKMEMLDLERDFDEQTISDVGPTGVGMSELPIVMKFKKIPGLTFTKIERATVDGQVYDKMNWAGLLLTVISKLENGGISGDALVRKLNIPAKLGEYVEEGYKFYPELGISIQGQSAQDAWKEINRISKNHHYSVEVQFRWRDTVKAQHPGKVGIIRAAA